MGPDSIAIVGVCAPERRRYARRVAAALRRRVVHAPGGRRSGSLPVVERDVADPRPGDGLVVEGATDLDVAHLAGSQHPPLSIVCVVDAQHMIDDLRDGVPLIDDAEPGDDRGDVGARARQAAAFIEAASLVALVNWESVETSRLSVLMALASHLNPTARIRLSRSAEDDVRALEAPVSAGEVWQQRAGWVRALNDEHDPYMTDRRVTTFRYEQLRPFHPGRLTRVLDEEIDSGRCGLVLRSVGFCRLASRPTTLARWEQVGSAMWIDPLQPDDGLSSIGQDIAVTGIDLKVERIVSALDTAAVTDAELAGGPAAWRRFADPLPAWPVDAGGHNPDGP